MQLRFEAQLTNKSVFIDIFIALSVCCLIASAFCIQMCHNTKSVSVTLSCISFELLMSVSSQAND